MKILIRATNWIGDAILSLPALRAVRRRFPDADVVVFGHSHVPLDERSAQGQRLFNPGSPTERRSAPHHTLGVLEAEDGALIDHRIVVVGPQ